MNGVKLAKDAMVYVDQIDPNRVRSTYNGRVGCACGCRGIHSYNEQYRAEASAERGYPIDDDEIRPRSMKATIEKINRALRGEIEVDVLIVDPKFVSVDIEGRSYAAYFAKAS